MDTNTAKDLDKILNYLYTKSGQLFQILDELQIDKKNKELLFKELDSRNFIHPRKSHNGNHFIEITPEGKAFIQSSSSFLNFSRKIKTEEKRRNNNAIMAIVSPIIAIVSIVVNIYFGFLNNEKSKLIDGLNSEIKTLKQEKIRLQDSLSLRPTFKTTDNKTTK